MLTQREAEQIARKLEAELKTKSKKHIRVLVRHQGRVIASYGIRRSSKEASHDYIPGQLHISNKQALELARCPLSKDQYFELLRSRGLL